MVSRPSSGTQGVAAACGRGRGGRDARGAAPTRRSPEVVRAWRGGRDPPVGDRVPLRRQFSLDERTCDFVERYVTLGTRSILLQWSCPVPDAGTGENAWQRCKSAPIRAKLLQGESLPGSLRSASCAGRSVESGAARERVQKNDFHLRKKTGTFGNQATDTVSHRCYSLATLVGGEAGMTTTRISSRLVERCPTSRTQRTRTSVSR